MATERTFSIIKPDATRRNLTGAINAKIEAAGMPMYQAVLIRGLKSKCVTAAGVW